MTAAQLRSARERLGLTQQQLADELGVDLRTVVSATRMPDVMPWVWRIVAAAMGYGAARLGLLTRYLT